MNQKIMLSSSSSNKNSFKLSVPKLKKYSLKERVSSMNPSANKTTQNRFAPLKNTNLKTRNDYLISSSQKPIKKNNKLSLQSKMINTSTSDFFNLKKLKKLSSLKNESSSTKKKTSIMTKNNLLNSKYKKIKKIGEGYSSKVFLAKDVVNKHFVSLKIISHNFLQSKSQKKLIQVNFLI